MLFSALLCRFCVFADREAQDSALYLYVLLMPAMSDKTSTTKRLCMLYCTFSRRFCVFADREAQDSALYLSWKVPSRPTATPAQYLEVMKVCLILFALFKLSLACVLPGVLRGSNTSAVPGGLGCWLPSFKLLNTLQIVVVLLLPPHRFCYLCFRMCCFRAASTAGCTASAVPWSRLSSVPAWLMSQHAQQLTCLCWEWCAKRKRHCGERGLGIWVFSLRVKDRLCFCHFFSASLADESACAAVDMFVLGVVCEEKKTLRLVRVNSQSECISHALL
jgi:hypothetical protein